MPRTYVRKREPNYSIDDLKTALNLIRKKKMTVDVASTQYHNPRQTLYARLSGSRGGGKPGGVTILSHEEEKFLIHVVHKYQEWQQPLTRSDLISIARTFMLELGKKNITNESSLHEWFYCFHRRWGSEIKLVETYKFEKIRSISCTKIVVDRWFDHLKQVLSKLNLFNRPEAIFNIDESAFGDDPGRKQVIIKRDSKYATCTHGGSGKRYTTLLICTSASGKFLPPYIIYRAQRLFDAWLPDNAYPGARFNATPSGWSEETIFYDWLCKQFVPAVELIRKLLIPSPTTELDPSTSQINTNANIDDNVLKTVKVSRLHRSSSCPNLVSNGINDL
ncbi:unnamed protein product [Rotaria sordida]|uniref:DDE-1 domain-containing protein n=1 Tax=Rotaria sordida TaxID=392033 RepID=A0A819RAV5_9BILA|nr:unnamed protein product [Rotaria sordida]